MKLEVLYEYVTLVKHRNFTHAAQELFLSQPSLSTHIIKLEEELGFELLDRSDVDFSLTPAGMSFLEYAQQALKAFEEAKEKCLALAREEKPLKIANLDPNSQLYETIIHLESFPFEFVDLDYDTSPFSALEKGVIDIAYSVDYSSFESIAAKAASAGITMTSISSERTAICMQKSHPLAEKDELSRADLKDASVMITSGAWFDLWKEVILSVLGPDLNLAFKLKPIVHVSNFLRLDYGDDIYVCGQNSVLKHNAQRDDVRIFEKIDDEAMCYGSGLIYLESNRRAAGMAEAVQQKYLS